MKRRLWFPVLVMVLAHVRAGTSGAAEAPVGSAGAADEATGVLVGRVSFEGTAPPPRPIQVNKDEAECGHAAGEVQDVVVGPGGGLSGVVVEIQGVDAPDDGPGTPAAGRHELRQRGCRFIPELTVIPSGADLAIYNDDPVLHNINTGRWNIGQPGGSDRPAMKQVRYPGRPLMRVNCNIHSWMEAWIYVARSPYHAVTDGTGSFRIQHIPTGTYEAMAVHPTLGTRRFEVSIVDGESTAPDVTFRGR